ncbi:hypothetical protein [Haloferax denitrificans]|uniref:hypothetical protein n=1 Tax=Haloferax denitrificans TaxID=35745 RepID=UPI0012678D6D|nr:hypothetical protein [Haloferax denitrificans]
MAVEHGSPATEEVKGVVPLVKCVLRHFNHVSVERIHSLIFLIEVEYFKSHENRITEVEYEPYLSGVFSSSIEEALAEIDGVEHGEVKIGRDRIKTLKVQSQPQCNLSGEIDELVRETSKEFGELPPSEILSELKSIQIYRQAKIGEVIEFDSWSVE